MPGMARLAVRFTIALAALLLVPIAAFAQAYRCVDSAGNVKYSDQPCDPSATPSSPQKKAFQARVLVVRSYAEIERWVRLYPTNRQGNIGQNRILRRDETYHFPIVVILNQLPTEASQLWADLQIVRPNGQVHRLPKCCSARADPHSPTTIVLNPVPSLIFDRVDVSGPYTLTVTVTDTRESVSVTERLLLR